MITIDERSKINLINYLKGQTKRIEEETYKAVADTASIIKSDTKHDAPVDTSALKKSISKRKIKKGEHVVRVGVPYGLYAELYHQKPKKDGTPGKPYWFVNVERGRDYLRNQIKKIK